MKYYKDSYGVVFAYEEDTTPAEGLTELTEDEVEAVLNPPEEAKTVTQQILELESQITPRNLRSALMGDKVALDKISDIEAQIATLRAAV